MNELGLGLLFDARDLASGTIQRVSRGMIELEGSSSKAAASIKDHFQSFATGLAVFGVGASMLAGGLALADASGKFSEQIAIVGVSGASAAELGELEKAAIAAGIATQFSPTQAATALGDLAQAGYNATESIDLLIPTLDLAAGSLGQLDPSGAAGLAAQTMKAFGIANSDAGITVDKLLQSVNAFALSANELPLALGTAARGAGVLKQGLDETLISLGLVKNIIPRVETAATAVSVAMERLVRPEVQQALLGIGVKATNAAGGFRPFLDVIQDLMPALGKMKTEAERSGFLLKTFGPEALGGMNAIMKQVTDGIKTNTGATVTGAEAIKYLRDQFLNAGGTAAGFRDALLDTFEGQKMLLCSMETLGIVLGKPFEHAFHPIVEAIVDALNKVIGFFQSLPPGVADFIAKIVVGVGVVLSLVGGIIAAKAAIGMLMVGLNAVGISIGGLAATVAPALLIVAAVTAAFFGLRYAMENNIGGLGDSVGGALKKVQLAWDALVQLFEDGGFSEAVLTEFSSAKNKGVQDFAIGIYVAFNKVSTFVDGFIDGFKGAFQQMGPVLEQLSTSFRAVLDLFGGLSEEVNPSAAQESFDAWGNAGRRAAGWVAKALEIVMKVITAAMDIVTGFASKWDVVKESLAPIGELFTDLSDPIKVFLDDLGLLNSGTEGLAISWKSVGAGIAAVFAAIMPIVKAAISAITGQFAALLQGIGGVIDIIDGLIHGRWAQVWGGIKRVIYAAISSALSLLGALVEGVAAAIDAIGKLGGKDLGLAKGISDFRKSLDESLASGLDVKTGTATAGRRGGGGTVDPFAPTNPEALAFFAPDAGDSPNASYVPTVPAGYASGLQAQAAQAQQSFNPEALNAAVAKLASTKPEVSVSSTTTLVVDGEVLARAVEKGKRSSGVNQSSEVAEE